MSFIRAYLELAGSGASLGFVDIPDRFLDADQSCFIDLQNLIFDKYNKQGVSLLNSTCACQLRVFAGHDKSELTLPCLPNDLCDFESCACWITECADVLHQTTVQPTQNSSQHDSMCVLPVSFVLSVSTYAPGNLLKLMAINLSHGWMNCDSCASALHDKACALAAVTRNGRSLKHFCDALKDDDHVVFAAVKSDGRAREFASTRLKQSPDLALLALKTFKSLRVSEFTACRDFAVEAVRIDGCLLKRCLRRLQTLASLLLPCGKHEIRSK